jgi:hypothetical protein
VLKLVCSKEEEAVLDKEQKLMKSFGFMDNRDNLYNVQSMLPSSHVPPGFMGQFNHSYVPPPRFRHPPFSCQVFLPALGSSLLNS